MNAAKAFVLFLVIASVLIVACGLCIEWLTGCRARGREEKASDYTPAGCKYEIYPRDDFAMVCCLTHGTIRLVSYEFILADMWQPEDCTRRQA